MVQRPQLRLFRTVWGLVAHAPSSSSALSANKVRSPFSRDLLKHLKAQGYHGLEASVSDLGSSTAQRIEHVAACAEEDMKLVVGAYTSWHDYEGGWDNLSEPPRVQIENLKQQVREIESVFEGAPSGTLAHVNAHCGGDSWTDAQSEEFFREACPIRPRVHGLEVGVSHETHRGRPLGCFFRTARLCDAVPELRLTLDMSHWVITAERLIGTKSGSEQRVLDLLLHRVDHVHARVGSPECPQLSLATMRSEWTRRCHEAHYAAWKRVWDIKSNAGVSHVTATPEYGPPPEYTPTTPGTDEALYDVWEQTEQAAEQLRCLSKAQSVEEAMSGRH